ncbi:MAG TPA: pyridoxamine kinase [Candidatus Limiplasma sp.]|nr:pyridoxamine kinase [Candidatus Limiplasma sp.]HRX09072.1 pyridoxamine kinase [Candidatus Limiplasma sp.]
MQKRAIAIHDISCVGRCSLTVALPILSAAGINTAVIPTALLSTHTGEFSGYTHLDLSDQLLPIAAHIETLGLHFDAFYSGYLASAEQVRLVLQVVDMLCDQQTHIFVDPAFADHGKLYSHMGDDMPAQMRRLCSRAHTIVPNFTEASFLLERPYQATGYGEDYVQALAAELAALGPECVVITDVRIRDGQTGIAVYRKASREFRLFFKPKFDDIFYGTGDTFASFLIASVLSGQPLMLAAQTALDCTNQAIQLTLDEGEPLRYGVQFERVLPTLIEALQKHK